MADHWVAEVFPPKFQFGSVDELLKSPAEGEKSSEKLEYLDDVYRRVYFEEQRAKTSTDEDVQVLVERLEKSRQIVSKQKKRQSKPKRKDQDECIWNENELQTLRRFLQKAKMQNLKLAAMLESAQEEIHSWKGKFKDVAESERAVKCNLGVLKKKYERLKVNYRALKEDLRRYHANLKISREERKQLEIERDETENLLKQTQAELNQEKLNKIHLQFKLDKMEKEKEENFKSYEDFITQQHLLEIKKLQKEINRLRSEFEKEKHDNDLNKRALEHFRSHFANLMVNQEIKNGNNMVENILSVIDIDYLPE